MACFFFEVDSAGKERSAAGFEPRLMPDGTTTFSIDLAQLPPPTPRFYANTTQLKRSGASCILSFAQVRPSGSGLVANAWGSAEIMLESIRWLTETLNERFRTHASSEAEKLGPMPPYPQDVDPRLAGWMTSIGFIRCAATSGLVVLDLYQLTPAISEGQAPSVEPFLRVDTNASVLAYLIRCFDAALRNEGSSI